METSNDSTIAAEALMRRHFRPEVKIAKRKLLALLEQERPKFIRMSRRVLGCEQDAWDAIQEATLLALRNLWRFDIRREMSPWFSEILRNQCLMMIRSRQRRHEVVDSECLVDGEPIWVEPEHEEEGVVSFRHHGQVVDTSVAALLSGLNRLEQQAFWDVWVDGVSKQEVCRRYGLSLDSINSLYSAVQARANARLSYLGSS